MYNVHFFWTISSWPGTSLGLGPFFLSTLICGTRVCGTVASGHTWMPAPLTSSPTSVVSLPNNAALKHVSLFNTPRQHHSMADMRYAPTHVPTYVQTQQRRSKQKQNS